MIKIGKVMYLNTYPMFYKLEGYPFIEDHPSNLVKKFLNREIDAGILSSALYLYKKQDFFFLDDISISGKDRVCSVLLFSKKEIKDIKDSDEIYLTEDSISSKILAITFLEDFYNKRPLYVKSFNDNITALLLIGDKAIKFKNENFPFIYDLGSMWYEKFYLPFVFALFTVRKELLNSNIIKKLKQDIKYSIDLFYKDLKANKIEIKEWDKTFLDYYFNDCLDLTLQDKHLESLAIYEKYVIKFIDKALNI